MQPKNTRRSTPMPAIHVIGPSIAYIVLTKGMLACIDAEDAEYLENFNWYAHFMRSGPYAVRKERVDGRQIDIAMHKVLCLGKEVTDHANRQTLHNWKGNLRAATYSENLRNMICVSKHGVKGVMLMPERYGYKRRWRANIRGLDGKPKHIGHFHTKEEAHEAYLKAARAIVGDFARG